MVEIRKKKFSKRIKLNDDSFSSEIGKHRFEVETSYMWILRGQIEIFNSMKKTISPYFGDTEIFNIVAEVVLDGHSDKIEIYYKETQWWVIMTGILMKDSDNRGQAWISIAKVLSLYWKQDYELWIVENQQDGLNDKIIIPLWTKWIYPQFDDYSDLLNMEREKRLKTREKTFQKYGRVCSSCWVTSNLDVHHILPRNMGGKDILSNLRILCRSCHERVHKFVIGDNDGNDNPRDISPKIKKIQQALSEGNLLYITYDKKQDVVNRITKREIKPINLYYREARQYLEAFCYLRNAKRCFRISKITKIEII